MHKHDPSEDINTRLNRELWRMRLGGWTGIMGAILVIVVVLVAFVKVPSETEFVLGKVTGVMSHATENGPLQEIGIVVEGQHRSASTRALLVHPATNDMICLRQTRY